MIYSVFGKDVEIRESDPRIVEILKRKAKHGEFVYIEHDRKS